MDVFLDDLPEVPFEREMAFDIELVLGTSPISISPYHMGYKSLKYLMEKKELNSRQRR